MGRGGHEANRATYAITGSSTFDVDFSNQRYSGSLALRGTGNDGAANVDFGSFGFSGTLASYLAETSVQLTYGGTVAGELTTRFYGPDGEEIGGIFGATALPGSPGAGTRMSGITVAKRQ